MNGGDDGSTPSLTPFTVYSTGYVGIGNNAPDNAVFNVRQSVATNPVCQIENTGVGTALRIQSGTDSSSHDIFKVFNGAGAQKFGCRADGPVFVGASSIKNKAFEVNNGTEYIYLDPGSSSAENFLVSNALRFSLYGGLTSGGQEGLTLNYSGTAYVNQSMGANSACLTSDTNSSSAAYLATTSSSNDTLIIDQRNGMMGAVTLTANITKIKIYWCNTKGAKSSTLKIKQHASAAKTVSWADVEVFSDNGSTSKGTDCFWSGGAAHVMSTGTDDIDIVQITTIPTTTSAVPAYCSVIGQNFS